MPGRGRPKKYFTETSRLQAKRAQNVEAVRRWRLRQSQAQSTSQSTSTSQSQSQSRPQPPHPPTLPHTHSSSSSHLAAITFPPSSIHDFSAHSSFAPIDLTFGTLQCLIADFRGRCARYRAPSVAIRILVSIGQSPERSALFRGADRFVEIALFAAVAEAIAVSGDRNVGGDESASAAATAVASPSSKSIGSWTQSRLAYHATLQRLSQHLSSLSHHSHLDSLDTARILIVCQALEYYEYAARDDRTWGVHGAAKARIVRLAGPKAFERAEQPLCAWLFRVVWRNQIVVNALFDRCETFLGMEGWRMVGAAGGGGGEASDADADVGTEIVDVVWNEAARIPGLLQRFDQVKRVEGCDGDDDGWQTALWSEWHDVLMRLFRIDQQLSRVRPCAPAPSGGPVSSAASRAREMCLVCILILLCNARVCTIMEFPAVQGSLVTQHLLAKLLTDSSLDHYTSKILTLFEQSVNDEHDTDDSVLPCILTQLVVVKQYLMTAPKSEDRALLLARLDALSEKIRNEPDVIVPSKINSYFGTRSVIPRMDSSTMTVVS